MKTKSIILLAVLATAACKKEEIQETYVSDVPEFYLTPDNSTPIVEPWLGLLDGILSPRDLDFKPGTNELWVMNKGSNGSDFVIIKGAGSSSQSIIKRKDSHSSHFVPNGTAIAFSDINTFATTPEIKNTVSDPNSTFMGPALWSGDLNVFAMVNQSNWDPNKPLGSHLDMLHQSPFSMGIAHEAGNSFWVLDGHNGNLCHYEFHDDHGPGGDDHRDGRIFRYEDLSFTRVNDIPSHIIMDKNSGKLYMCDTYNGTVVMIDPSTASATTKLTAPNEILDRYYKMEGATSSVFASGLQQPSGIDINGNRLFVSDYKTGIIHVYNLETKEEIATLDTGSDGITGIKVSKDNRLWFVNYLTNKLYQVIPK